MSLLPAQMIAMARIRAKQMRKVMSTCRISENTNILLQKPTYFYFFYFNFYTKSDIYLFVESNFTSIMFEIMLQKTQWISKKCKLQQF